MDILKRDLAPVTTAAWELIDQEAARTLRAHLTARTFVDVVGPKGLDFAAVNLGRVDVPDKQARGVHFGIRRVLPLVELRAQFELNLWELDNVERGAADIDLSAVSTAAKELARFEENAVYKGFAPAGIKGLKSACSHKPLQVGAGDFPDAVTRAMLMLQESDVEGPYNLVLGPDPYRALESGCNGYPPRKRVENLIGGRILVGLSVEGGFLVSTRGGDMELVLGQEPSIGYETHDSKKVRLYLGETMTFRVLAPEAAVPFTFKKQA